MEKRLGLICSILCCLLLPACKKRPAQPAIYALTTPLSAKSTPQYPACPLRDDVVWQTWALPEFFAVHAVVVDEQWVWFSDDFGTYRIDTQTGEYTRYPELPSARLFLPVGDGRLWAADNRGLIYFDGESWIRVALAPTFDYLGRISELRVDRDGDFWFQTMSSTGRSVSYNVFQYPGHIPPESEPWEPLPQSDYEWDIYNCEGWQAASNTQITYRSTEECQQVHETAQRVEALNGTNIFATNGQDLWWIAVGGGLFHAKDGITTNIPLSYNVVYRLVADSTHGVWAGTSQGLLYADEAGARWLGQTTDTDACILPERPIDIAVDTHGDVWLTTDNGLFTFLHGGACWESVFDPKLSNEDSSRFTAPIVAATGGGVWATHGWDLWEVNEKAPTTPPDLNPICRFDSMAVDKRGDVWITGLGCGMWQYLPATGTWIRHDTGNDVTWVTIGTDGAVYAIGGDGSLNVYTGTATTEPVSGVTQPVWNPVVTDAYRVAYGRSNVAGSDGGAWVNTGEDVVWYAYDGRQVPLGHTLPGPIFGLSIDKQDRLWIWTGKTFFIYDGVQITSIPTPLDGINEMTFGADGRVWITGPSKVAVYNPNAAGQP
ncbi:MAG: hypothetical protein JXA21_07205 [Anaerolineae bacterium]|nr:hypothetical protein [Anaerolineae bacterium]